MTQVSGMRQNVRDQRRRDQEALERLEVIIAERRAQGVRAMEHLGDALALQWEIRDGMRNADEALREIERMERVIR